MMIFRFRSWPVFVFTGLSALLLGAGCGTLENGRGWGQDALWPVDSQRVVRAARDALLDPGTLIPLAGAAVFAIDDFDNRASDWAARHNPLFGSEDGASDASDYLKHALQAEAIATALATPSGDTTEEWLSAKLRGGVVEAGAVAAAAGLTGLFKDVTDRQRPDRSGDNSFPSGHATYGGAYATLSNRNLGYIDSLDEVRPAFEAANTVLAVSVGWARVEAGRHHPSDVLVGMALGHFVAAFVHDAFLNLPEDGRVDVTTFPVEAGAGLALSLRF